MKIIKTSFFKDTSADIRWFKNWVSELEAQNDRKYEYYEVETSLGKTQIWGLNSKSNYRETLVIFPGARTSSLIWDLDHGLDHLGRDVRILMVETNGLPNLSHGKTPDIKSLDYGLWAAEVFDSLSVDKAFVAGASFGGLVAMKMGIVAPERIKAAFLLNPGCLQPFSLKLQNLYYNLLPIISPNERNVRTFLDQAIFSKPHHQLSAQAETMLVKYELFALTRYKDKTQKPYYMEDQLNQVEVDTYLIEGTRDLLFPFQKSIDNARKHLKHLKDVKVFENVGHGIETHSPAIKYIKCKINSLSIVHG